MLNNPESDNKTPATTYDKAIAKKVVLNPNVSESILAANFNRAYAVIVNRSYQEVTLFFGLGDAELEIGILLTTKGSSYEIKQDNLYVGRIAAIAEKSAELCITECSF